MRGTGRTTRMLETVVQETLEGRNVAIVGHTWRYALELCRMAVQMGAVKRLVHPSSNPAGCRGYDAVYVDHAYYEAQTGPSRQ